MAKAIADLTIEELQQRFRNARTTLAKSVGHRKRDRNRDCVAFWEHLIRTRGGKVPPADETGQFNGVGSS